jgi:DNA (cytosine-5)-methyltransferase 1
MMTRYTSVELCAGAGGQALGLEKAGFEHLALVEHDPWARATLKRNRPRWNVVEGDESDIFKFQGAKYRGADLVAAGVPCPPFSKAGQQLGRDDERDLFPQALRIVGEIHPRAVLFENVRGLLDPKFEEYRAWVAKVLADLGYSARWGLLNASDYGVPQLRPRTLCVALRSDLGVNINWPPRGRRKPKSVGQVLVKEMGSAGWRRAGEWAERANRIAPTLVGGSKKHGGPDLGPTRAKQEWRKLAVDALGLADEPPVEAYRGFPKLTVSMTALLQGFPPSWKFVGGKTNAYRQVGNAFPPPVASAVGRAILEALLQADGRRTVTEAAAS